MNKTTIELKELTFYAYHGVLPEEASMGQRFKIDVKLRLVDGLEFAADTPECTVNYAEVYAVVQQVFVGSRYQLLERAAEAIAAAILEHFTKVNEVSVTVKKPSVPVECICTYFSVEVTRCR